MEQKWILERLGGHLERLGGVLGRLGSVLGRLGCLLEHLRLSLATSEDVPGCLWGRPGGQELRLPNGGQRGADQAFRSPGRRAHECPECPEPGALFIY